MGSLTKGLRRLAPAARRGLSAAAARVEPFDESGFGASLILPHTREGVPGEAIDDPAVQAVARDAILAHRIIVVPNLRLDRYRGGSDLARAMTAAANVFGTELEPADD